MLRNILSILLIMGSFIALGDIAEPHYYELFETGNAHYKADTYDSAKLAYAEIVNNGYTSAELFYNYGNSFFKTGNVPAAILYYERALSIDPVHVDSRHNLEVANSFIADNIEPIEQLFISKWWNGLAVEFSTNVWAWFVIGSIVFGCIGLTIYFTNKLVSLRQIGFFSSLTCFLFVVIGFSMAQTSERINAEPYAIVFTPSVNVKSEPDLKATVQFVIHEGLKVKILDTEDEWSRISLSDGNSGWIPSSSIEEIQ